MDTKVENFTDLQTHLVVCPIRKVNEDSFHHQICSVTIGKDGSGEYQLDSVTNRVTGEKLLPDMDSVSKQKTLHNILSQPSRSIFPDSDEEHMRDLKTAQGPETIESIFKRDE